MEGRTCELRVSERVRQFVVVHVWYMWMCMDVCVRIYCVVVGEKASNCLKTRTKSKSG